MPEEKSKSIEISDELAAKLRELKFDNIQQIAADPQRLAAAGLSMEDIAEINAVLQKADVDITIVGVPVLSGDAELNEVLEAHEARLSILDGRVLYLESRLAKITGLIYKIRGLDPAKADELAEVLKTGVPAAKLGLKPGGEDR